MSKNHYEIFEISHTASQDEIKAAYRRLALKYHPDRNQSSGNSDTQMKEINFIYSILSNPEKRQWYDSTISFSNVSDSDKEDYSYSQSYIYCNEIEITDSAGNRTKVNIGDSIFYLVEIDKSIVTWKYKSLEYFDVVVKNIFDPAAKEFFARVISFDFNKTPLLLVHWGNSEMIVYKEDFETFWINQATYNKLDKRKGVVTALIVIGIFGLAAYYFFNKYSLSSDKVEQFKSIQESNAAFVTEESEYYKKNYFATDTEVTYILSEYYYTCTKQKSKATYSTEIYNIPDKLGIIKGEIKKGDEVILLLFCPKLDKYKIKKDEIIGWVNSSALENPVCDHETKNNDEN